MGLDTECDLAVEAEGIPRLREKIAEFRSRLLAEHLGTSPEKEDRESVPAGETLEKGKNG